jgi:hypothetical protein
MSSIVLRNHPRQASEAEMSRENEQIPGFGGTAVMVHRQPAITWRPHRGTLPAGLQSFGLGATPVYSHADRAWYAKPSSDVLRYGFGAPLDDAASAVMSYFSSNPCTSASVQQVSDFQTQYNAARATPPLAVDGKYGVLTQSALQTYLNGVGAGTAPAACYDASGNYIGPGSGGGGGGGSTPPIVIVPPSSSSSGTTNYTPWLIGAGVVSAGLVGYAVYKKKKHGRRH